MKHTVISFLFLAALSFPSLAAESALSVRGRIIDAQTGAGLSLVNILVVETNRGTASGPDGRFELAGLTAGHYHLRLSSIGYQDSMLEITISPESDLDLGTVSMEVWTLRLDEVVVSPGRFNIMGMDMSSRQTLSEANLRNMSWSEDITRAVSRLPGVSSSDFSSKFTIRGGEADEVMLTLDGMELYEPFHQRDKSGGLFSIVDIETIRSVDLMTGGFPAEYGNRMSGVFAMQTRDAANEAPKTSLGLSLMNARIYTQGQFASGKGSYMGSFRKGLLDQTFKLIPDAEVVPKYHDVLFKATYQLNPRHKASLHVLEAGDRTEIEDRDSEGNFDYNHTKYRNVYAWGTLSSIFSSSLSARTIAFTGWVNHDRFGSFHKYEPSDKGDFMLRDVRDYSFTGLKQDWIWIRGPAMTLAAGFEARKVDASYDYDIDLAELRVDGDGNLVDHVRREHITLNPSGNQIGIYLSGRVKAGRKIALEPGIRFDHTGYSGDDVMSPRLGMVFALGSRTFLRAAWGKYYQSRFINEIDVNNGQHDFSEAQLATHQVIGLEHRLRNGIEVRMEAYHKNMSNLSPQWTTLRDQQEMFPEQRNDNARLILDGARADGVELFVKRDQGGRFSWWISYALARAQNDIRDIEFDQPLGKRTGWVDRPNNQKHTIYADLNYRPNGKWHLNFSFQFWDGWPRTDYTYDYLTLANGDLHFYPIEKEFNATPYPAYHRLDVRATRHFQTRRGVVDTYVQIINVYNRENLRKFDLDTRNDADEYSLDAQGNYIPFEDNLNWFGILPVFGATWSF